jgi:hypothetical protein
MEIGKGSRGKQAARTRRVTAVFSFPFPFSILLLALCSTGCGTPGEPIERKPPVPAAIHDLTAEQSGNAVILTFTLPRESTDRRVLKEPPDIEIYRSFSTNNTGARQAERSAASTLWVTIPSGMVDRYAEQGRIRYADVLHAQDFAQQPNESAAYMVRTRESLKKASPDSNVAGLRIYPAADPIEDLKSAVVHSVVTLAWTPPQKTPVGPVPAIKGYAVYRAQAQSAAVSEAPHDGQPEAPAVRAEGARAKPNLKLQFQKISETEAPHYEDSQVEYNKTYAYAVRSIVEYSGEEIESDVSNIVTVTARDTVPPSPPEGLIVVFVPAEAGTPAHLDLSWSINPETDVAGYNVYRTEEQGILGARLNPELLPTPTFRDMSAVAGRRYFYSVTAADRSGNESSPSTAVAGEMPAENQPRP